MTRIFIGLTLAMAVMLWLFVKTDGFDHPVMVKLYQERCLPGKCSYDD